MASIHLNLIAVSRIKVASPGWLQQWFNDLKKVLVSEEFNIKPENIYNIDESRFAICEKEVERCIINTQIHQQYQVKSRYQE